jgi:O-acetyl-ADP-ribose deacetylase
MPRIRAIKGDITRLKVDAIVNAANNSLLGGGGVDGAIHAAAGPGLLEECRGLRGCPTGEARITKGYNLHASFIIHTVGPIWRDGSSSEDEMLSRCYRSCIELADKHDIKEIAFPSVSTGAYGFPVERASIIAVDSIRSSLETCSSVEAVLAVCFDDMAYECYQKALKGVSRQMDKN